MRRFLMPILNTLPEGVFYKLGRAGCWIFRDDIWIRLAAFGIAQASLAMRSLAQSFESGGRSKAGYATDETYKRSLKKTADSRNK